MKKSIDPHITCAFLYPITRYGYPPPAQGMEEYIREMAELGFRSVELEGIGGEHLEQVYGKRFSIRSILEEYELEVPVFCTVLPGLTSLERSVARHNMELFRKGCETACYLDARGVLDNGPLLPYIFPEDMEIHRHYTPEVLRYTHIPESLIWGQWWAQVLEYMDEACDIAFSFGLDYYLHPCMGALTDTTDAYLLLKRELGRKNLKFCLDTANQFFMRENLQTALRKLVGELDYIHLSDTSGERIEHHPMGKGKIAWDDFFATLKKIGFRGNIAVDVGGQESDIPDLEKAFLDSAELIEEKFRYYEIH